MSKQFENDKLLQDLKKASKNKAAPKLDEQILVEATLARGDSRSMPSRLSRKPVTWLAGLGATAAIVGLSFSMTAAPNAKTEFGPFQVPESFKFNMSQSSNDGAKFSRVWIPEVVAKASPNLSTSQDGWGSLYEAVYPLKSEDYAKFLASYFGVQGEITKESGFSSTNPDTDAKYEFYVINDRAKKIEITVSTSEMGMTGFSVDFQGQAQDLATADTQDVISKMDTLLHDLAISKSDSRYRAIEFAEVRLTPKNKFSIVEVNRIVDGREMDFGFSAIFNDDGQLRQLYGSLTQFDYKGTVARTSEADAVNRLGDYWDNPYRVQSVEDSLLTSSTLHCENEPKMGMKCETTVDKAERGFAPSRDRDGKLWLVPSYSMYHKGHFIGAVNAMRSDYLNVPG
jgi:hypothetical protein